MYREGRFSTLTEGQSVQASGRFSLLRFAKFLGEGVGGWVSLEEGLPQHALRFENILVLNFVSAPSCIPLFT